MDINITRFDVGAISPLWLEERAEIDIIVPPEARITAPTAVLHLHGSLDGSTYEHLVNTAQQELATGVQKLIIDLERVQSVSNAGIIGLYMIGALLHDESLDGLEGYEVIHRMQRAIELEQTFPCLILIAPMENVSQALTSCGLARVISIQPSVNEAINNFPHE